MSEASDTERLNEIERDTRTGPVTQSQIIQLEAIDKQRSEIQRGGERQCRKIVKPKLPFSPPIRGIDMRRRAFTNLVAWHRKGGGLGGNVFRAALRAGIEHPRSLTVSECLAGIKACKQPMAEQEEKAGLLRRKHLHNRYELAFNLNDPVKCKQIKKIIIREEQWDQWACIKQGTGEPQNRATNLVQRMEGENIVNILEASAMSREIQQLTEKRFNLARSSPITNSFL